jgi:hypothetical protein
MTGDIVHDTLLIACSMLIAQPLLFVVATYIHLPLSEGEESNGHGNMDASLPHISITKSVLLREWTRS